MESKLARLIERTSPLNIRWGLERTQTMLAALGEPHREARVVHVAGTNGKGSTAACVDGILRAAGHRTGLYTSPHLEDFAERIRIDGEPATRQLLEECSEVVLPLATDADATFFEAATVLAFEAFRRAGCEVVVAEVGLGGRLDATNIVSPAVTVITSIDYDHSHFLGDTLEEIAGEKAGILKPGIAAVIGDLPDGARDVVLRRAREVGAPVDLFGRDLGATDVRIGLDGTGFTYRDPESGSEWRLRTPLIGSHQAINAVLALRAVQLGCPPIHRESVAAGLAAVRWPGRMEVIRALDGTWVLDLAHNAPAVAALAAAFEELPLPEPRVVLVAILGDKPWRDMLGPLLEVSAAAVFTVAPSSPPARRWSPDEALRIVGDESVEVEIDFDVALARARELAGSGTVIVTGSAHTVGDARHRIRGQEDHGI